MKSYNLSTLKAAENLYLLCRQYQDKVTVDVTHGRYTVDGMSLLGLYSLVGHVVTIEAIGDEQVVANLYTDIDELA